MTAMKVVVVGGGVAGAPAAEAAKVAGAEVTLVSMEEHIGYSRCGLPYLIGGKVKSPEDLTVYPESDLKRIGVEVVKGKAVDVSRDGKLRVELNAGGSAEISFDSLVLATGASAVVPPIKGADLPGVYTLRTIDDALEIMKAVKESKTAVIVGAGFIGLELAENFTELGLKAVVVEMLPHVLPAVLDSDMAKILQKHLKKHGVELHVKRRVEEIAGESRAEEVIVQEVGGVKADLVVLATGVRAETELAKVAGAEIGATRGIKVDWRLQTTQPGVYACGDCAEVRNLVTGQPALIQLGTAAVRQGRVAGENAAGGRRAYFGGLASAVTKLFGMQVGATGLTVWQAEEAGLPVEGVRVVGRSRPHYYPGAERIYVKLVAETEQGRVVGAQIMAPLEVAPRINLVATAIQAGLTVSELAAMDSCYAPPVSEYVEPVARAAQELQRRLKK
ncbi:MAG: hypothetical protein DRN96_08540 [Thermoproteota archaeon]|nr:MAG: hypothetical protein DRN96_08540 [Candidatus Korarchaeota archaeon]